MRQTLTKIHEIYWQKLAALAAMCIDNPHGFLLGSWKQEISNSALKDVTQYDSNNSSQLAI
jgi:hypothetical protein